MAFTSSENHIVPEVDFTVKLVKQVRHQRKKCPWHNIIKTHLCDVKSV